MIRLFTSGTHNGMTFDNSHIEKIYSQSVRNSPERIPFVLGHPKNDLPVVGYLPKKALKKFTESQNESIGFERLDTEFSQESLEALRKLGNNKLSIRLHGGVIKHIGLVNNPAVAANADQDFEALTGTYDFAQSLLMDEKQSLWEDFIKLFKKEKKQIDMNIQEPMVPDSKELESLRAENTKLKAENAANIKAQEEATKAQAVASFNHSIKDFALNKNQRLKAKLLAEQLASVATPLDFEHEGKTISSPAVVEFATLLGEIAQPPEVVQGSVTAAFANSNANAPDAAIDDELERQFKNL